jgi:hypothetical protein
MERLHPPESQSFRVDLLEREVLRRAFADSFATQLGQCTTRDRHDPWLEVLVVDGRARYFEDLARRPYKALTPDVLSILDNRR